jgi:translation initiation factor IF-1
MVLNASGGNKGKGVARKFVTQHTGGAKTVRLAQEGETYAIVKQLLGNCMCSVICSDGYKRLCIIRKKFTGRRKADNNVMSGTVVLVGVHDYGGGLKSAAASSSKSSTAANKCDLLYVYGDQEREKLRKACDLSKLNASIGDTSASAIQPDEDTIKFVSSGTGVFNKYANEESRKNMRTVAGVGVDLGAPTTESTHRTTIFGNQWLGDDMLPSDEDEDEAEDEDEDEEEEDDEDEDEDEEEEEVKKVEELRGYKQTTTTTTHKQQKPQVQIINVDDI